MPTLFNPNQTWTKATFPNMEMVQDFIWGYLLDMGLQYKEPVLLSTGHVFLEYCEPSND